MRIDQIRFAAIDFEGAGAAPGRSDEPVQVAIAHLADGQIREALTSYVRPTQPVTWVAQKVHGITDEMVADAPPFVELWPRIRDAMQGCWIVAHGAATEKRFLRVFPFHTFGPWVDTLALTRAAYPLLTSHALGDVICSLGLKEAAEISTEGFRWHDAACDAVASLVLLRHLVGVCRLHDADPEILRRPDLSAYFSARKESIRQQ